MPQSEEKAIYQVVIPKDLGALVDKLAEEIGISRSAFILACIESSMDDLRSLSWIGLTPRRLGQIARKLKSLGVIRKGDYEVDLRKLNIS